MPLAGEDETTCEQDSPLHCSHDRQRPTDGVKQSACGQPQCSSVTFEDNSVLAQCHIDRILFPCEPASDQLKIVR